MVGPIRYTGSSGLHGRFQNVPVYSQELKQRYGGDGRVGGLLEMFRLIEKKDDHFNANQYGQAKRVLSKKAKFDAIDNLVKRTPDNLRSAELDERYRRAQYEYETVASWLTYSDGEQIPTAELQRIVDGVEAGMMTDSNGAVVAGGSNAHIVEFWDRYQAYNKEMIKMAYGTGLITLEARDQWLSEEYMPFYTDFKVGDNFPVGTSEVMKKGRNVVEVALEGAYENKPSDDLMGSIMQNTQALMRDALQNVASLRTVRDSLDLKEAEQVDIGAMRATVDDRILRVMDQGVAKFYRLEDANLAMSSMMSGFSPRKTMLNLFGDNEMAADIWFGSGKLLRESVTKSPIFMAKNIFRDSWSAMVLTGGGPSIFFDAIRNATTWASYDRAQELGLAIGIDFVAEEGEYGKNVEKILKRDKARLGNWQDPDSGPVDVFASAWGFMDRLAGQSEVATRLAVYDRVLAKTGDRALAQHMAIEIMNYGRRGANPAFSVWTASTPFMNGRIQGLSVFARAHMGAPDSPTLERYGLTSEQYEQLPDRGRELQRRMVLKRGGTLAVYSAMYYLLMRFFDEDDEYANLRDDVKADNWMLPISKKVWLSLPIPFEVGLLYKWLPENIMRYVFEHDYTGQDFAEDAWRQVGNTMAITPPFLPNLVWDAIRNNNSYTGDDIVDYYMAQREPLEQRNAMTGETAIIFAEMANKVPGLRKLEEVFGSPVLTSPQVVQYIAYAGLGTTIGYAKLITDRWLSAGAPVPGFGDLREERQVVGTRYDFDMESLVTGEGLDHFPVIGDLLKDPREEGGLAEDYYNTLRDLERVVTTLSAMRERDPQAARLYASEHRTMLRWQHRLKHMDKRLRDWGNRRDYFLEHRDYLSRDQARSQWATLVEQRKDILSRTRQALVSIQRDDPKLLDKQRRRWAAALGPERKV